MDYSEDPLERHLDAESDEEFGEPVIRDPLHHHAREDVDGNLRSWTAEDFASIYYRFRPHLVRHARRYLSNDNQAEEVVQDAFLFLMTALPEIDSELGVLKFLKWKIKYLALDLIKANSKSTNLEPSEFDLASDEAPVDEELIKADDAAVIRMALAKLNPRHREALIASINEEKSSEQLAADLGTNENAARQLVFRARKAFKKALLGDIDTTGLSTNALLSIAIKKASSEARENVGRVGGFILVLALSAFGLNQLSSQSNQPTVIAQNPPAFVEFGPESSTEEDTADPESSASFDDADKEAESKEEPGENLESSLVDEKSPSDSLSNEENDAQITESSQVEEADDSTREVDDDSLNSGQDSSSKDEPSYSNVLSTMSLAAANRNADYTLRDIPGKGTRIYVYSSSGLEFSFLLLDDAAEEITMLEPSFKNIEGQEFEIISLGSNFLEGTKSGSLTAVGEVSFQNGGQQPETLNFSFSGELDRLRQPISASIYFSE